jgi:predicted CxxxxCH...CXXCH cytochrome family protein
MRLFWRYHEAGSGPASLLVTVLMLTMSACGDPVSNAEVQGVGTLDCPMFQATVSSILDQDIGGRTCSAAGCHLIGQSAGGAFKIYANAQPNTAEMDYNYRAAKGFANLTDPPQSKLLLEPLAGAQSIVGSHAGGDIFVSTSDPNYQTILTWITNQIQGTSSCFP